jgi:hypothetical protein
MQASEQNERTSKGQAADPQRTPSTPGETDFRLAQTILALGIIVLMSFLFSLLFKWQQKAEQATYFGKIYHDTVETLEFSRVSAPIDEKWNQQVYLFELLRGASDRARSWLAENSNQKPQPSEQLRTLLTERGDDYLLQRMQEDLPWLIESELRSPKTGGYTTLWETTRSTRPGSSGVGGLGGSAGGYGDGPSYDAPRAGRELTTDEVKAEERRLALQKEMQNYQTALQAWAARAAAQVWTWYQTDREAVRKVAQQQANRALDVDFSTLRGRGPEFVLEFTAVVVIIFAAVILGILKILESEQIGTLLAAIAGYVLGRATTRGRVASGENQAPEQSEGGKEKKGT